MKIATQLQTITKRAQLFAVATVLAMSSLVVLTPRLATAMGGDGEPLWIIQNCNDLRDMYLGVSAYTSDLDYELAGNIDCDGVSMGPIGFGSQDDFTGTFDGKGYAISNLTLGGADAEEVGLDAYLQNVGVDQNREVAVPNNIHMGGWFVDSVRPGDKGLSIIDGHLNGNYQDGIFIDLDTMKQGDIYTIEFGDGSKKQFKIKTIHSVELDTAASVLFSQDPAITNQLTLITCGGVYDRQARLYDKRVIVVSELVQ